MKSDKFMDAIGALEDELIAEADEVNAIRTRKIRIWKYTSIAACLAVTVTVLLVFLNSNIFPFYSDIPADSEDNSVTPTESREESMPFMADTSDVHQNAPTTSTEEETSRKANLIVLGELEDILYQETSYIYGGDIKQIYKIKINHVYLGAEPETESIFIDVGSEGADYFGYSNVGMSYLLALRKEKDYMPTLVNCYHGTFIKDEASGTKTLKEIMAEFGDDGWNDFINGPYTIAPIKENVNLDEIKFLFVSESFTQAPTVGYNASTLQYTVDCVSYYYNVNVVDSRKIYITDSSDINDAIIDSCTASDNTTDNLLSIIEGIKYDKRHKLFDDDGVLRDGYVFILADVTVKNIKNPSQVDPEHDPTEHYYYGNITYKQFPDSVMKIQESASGFEYCKEIFIDEEGNEIEKYIPEARYWSESTVNKPESDTFYLGPGETTTWQEGVIVRIDLLEKYGLCRIMGYSENGITFPDCVVDLGIESLYPYEEYTYEEDDFGQQQIYNDYCEGEYGGEG